MQLMIDGTESPSQLAAVRGFLAELEKVKLDEAAQGISMLRQLGIFDGANQIKAPTVVAPSQPDAQSPESAAEPAPPEKAEKPKRTRAKAEPTPSANANANAQEGTSAHAVAETVETTPPNPEPVKVEAPAPVVQPEPVKVEQPKVESAPTPPTAAAALTKDDCHKALETVLAKHGMPYCRQMLTDLYGAPGLSAVPVEKYAEFIAECAKRAAS